MKSKSLFIKLGKKYPASLQEPWDHCLYQMGKSKENINTILLCLDFDEMVYDFMENNDLFSKVDLIITHHPFLFGTPHQVLSKDEKKRTLYNKLIEKNALIYSYHTNFDTAKDGMNDALAEKLELTNVREVTSCPMARIGNLKKEMEVKEFSSFAKNKLNINYGLLLNYGKKMIKTVAIIGGGGSKYYKDAMLDGADIYISGDCPHHVRRDIITSNFNYLDLPHEIEKIFIDKMESVLLSFDKTLKIIKVDHEKEPEVI